MVARLEKCIVNNLDLINYSSYLNDKTKAIQVLSNPKDKKLDIDTYRKSIVNKLMINNNYLAIPNQVHSDNVQFINSSGSFNNTDGLLANKSDIILCLQTADCLPIFLFDKSSHMKGLIHSGWKGTKNKIIQKALSLMLTKGSMPSDIIIVIGASIQKCCYEIGDDLIQFFNNECIYIVDDKKYLSLQEQILIDVSKFNILKSNIYIEKRCTFSDTDLSSYRRDGDNAGRMISFLGDF